MTMRKISEPRVSCGSCINFNDCHYGSQRQLIYECKTTFKSSIKEANKANKEFGYGKWRDKNEFITEDEFKI